MEAFVMSSEKPVVLVTGASTGIGLCLARLIIKDGGYRLALSAREKSMSRFPEEGIHPSENLLLLPLDVTAHDERVACIQKIEAEWGGVDILVNNAGISYRAVVEHMNDEEQLQQLSTNYLAPMALIRLVLPRMRQKREGRIINISSVGGMMAMPTMSAYSASKFALEGSSESLWYEMKPWNIKVSVVAPGFIRSKSFEHVYYSKESHDSEVKHGPYSEYYDSMAPFVAKMMHSSTSTAKDVAQKIFKTMKKKNPRLRIPATLDAHFFFWLRRLIPRQLYHKILYWGLPGAKGWAKKNRTD